MSTTPIAHDRDGWPIYAGSLVRFERAGATVRGWVERAEMPARELALGDDARLLTVTDEKRGISRSTYSYECTVCKPTHSQKMRRSARSLHVDAANTLARKDRKGVR